MKKNILLITTGGTIASAESQNGLTPTINSEELIKFVPEIKYICSFKTYEPIGSPKVLK